MNKGNLKRIENTSSNGQKKGPVKQIISVSRRTDIPAFYSKWFINRVREGYANYPNPIYPKRIHTVSLSPETVAGFVFWTRNPKPLMPHLEELDNLGFAYYFQYTVVNYPKNIEPHSPQLDKAIKTFAELSRRIGKNKVIWRYDPIIINTDGLDVSWHKENFRKILHELSEFTEKVIVSIVDPYEKTKRQIGDEQSGTQYEPNEYKDLLSWIVKQATGAGIIVQSCGEALLSVKGIEKGACVDANLMEHISGSKVSKARHNQRDGCLCHRSVDIGVNNTCGFGCKYCYATNHEQAVKAIRLHKPRWKCLTGDFDATVIPKNKHLPQPG